MGFDCSKESCLSLLFFLYVYLSHTLILYLWGVEGGLTITKFMLDIGWVATAAFAQKQGGHPPCVENVSMHGGC